MTDSLITFTHHAEPMVFTPAPYPPAPVATATPPLAVFWCAGREVGRAPYAVAFCRPPAVGYRRYAPSWDSAMPTARRRCTWI